MHVNVGSKKARTQTMKRNVNPEWGERLVIAAPDAAKPVTLKVRIEVCTTRAPSVLHVMRHTSCQSLLLRRAFDSRVQSSNSPRL